jgi:hypothetical protein
MATSASQSWMTLKKVEQGSLPTTTFSTGTLGQTRRWMMTRYKSSNRRYVINCISLILLESNA